MALEKANKSTGGKTPPASTIRVLLSRNRSLLITARLCRLPVRLLVLPERMQRVDSKHSLLQEDEPKPTHPLAGIPGASIIKSTHCDLNGVFDSHSVNWGMAFPRIFDSLVDQGYLITNATELVRAETEQNPREEWANPLIEGLIGNERKTQQEQIQHKDNKILWAELLRLVLALLLCSLA